MPMELLQRLADTDMPATVTDPGDIYKMRVLMTAGHIYASIPLPRFEADGRLVQDAATVHQVTALGHKVLRYFGPRPQK